MKHQKPRPQSKVNQPHQATGSTTLKRGNQDSPNFQASYGAGNGVRTRDPKLGKLVLYQLSYARAIFLIQKVCENKYTPANGKVNTIESGSQAIICHFQFM